MRFSLGVTGVTDRRPLICQQHTANYIQQGGNDGRTRFFFSSFLCPYSVLFLRNILSRDYRILTNKKFGRKRKGHHPAARGGDAVKANENQSTHLVGNRKRKRENTRRRRRQRRTGFSSILFSFFLSFSPVLQDARKLRDDTLTLDAACSTRFRETTKEQQSTIPIF